MKRLRAVIIKEFNHILRDPTSLTIVFILPVVMMIIYGYGINFDLKKVDAGIIDFNNGEYSRNLIKAFGNNKYFKLHDLKAGSAFPVQKGEELLRKGELKEVIIIPKDFSRSVVDGTGTKVSIIIDGSDSNVANLIYQYNERILAEFMSGINRYAGLANISTKIYFNPQLKSSFFFIPGLVAVLLLMISAMLTSISIARERESGSLNLIFISPLKSSEIIIGKTLPYTAVAFLVGLVILVFAKFWFGIPIRGSVLTLALFSVIYVITGLSMGVMISTIAPSQKTAMFATLLITMLPSILLSGFIFPLTSLGPVLRFISGFIPATYFLRIIRGVVLRGAGINVFVTESAVLLGFSLILLLSASFYFQKLRKRPK